MTLEKNSNSFVKFLQNYWSIIFVFFLFIIGFLLRLFFLLKTPYENPDVDQYIEIAQFIFGKESTSYIVPREPFYPFVLGLVFLIFPETFLTARIYTAFLGSINIVLAFYVTKKYIQNFKKEIKYEKFAIISSLLICLNYDFIKYDGWGVREPLYTLLFFILLCSILIKRKPIKKVTFSICSFLLILTKAESLIFLIGIAILVFQKENFLNAINNNTEVTKNDDTDIENEGVVLENRVEISEKSNKLKSFLSEINFSFCFIFLGLLLGLLLWKLISYFLFGDPFASGNWMAGIYFGHEFKTPPPENLSTFRYLFDYHSFKELISAFYNGFFQMISVSYYSIFDRYLFAFFIITFIILLIKKDYISLFWILYPPIVLGIFAYFWDLHGYIRILLPYSIIVFISAPYHTYKIFEDFKIMISEKLSLKVKKHAFYYAVFGFICIKYLIRIIAYLV